MEAVQTQPTYPRGLDFEQVWAALMEDREHLKETDRILKENAERHKQEMKESAERHERELKESAKRHERELKEWQQETAERSKKFEQEMKESKAEFNEKLGKYINLFGEVTEYTMAPKLREKFIEFGFDFPKANRNMSIRDKINNIFLEADVFLENGDKAILVEIKTKLTIERINIHIDRLEKMRKYADLHGDKRTFLGAVAGVVVTDEVRNYALNQGFYLIEPSGENLNITPPNGNPKEW
jgi:ribosomal protein L9